MRLSWRIGPADLSIGNTRTWEAALKGAEDEMRDGLRVAGAIRSELHNLLLYEPGDHFAAHRDTEKLDGQFGTLVLMLPAVPEGGLLVVHHDSQSMAFPPDGVDREATLAQATGAAYYGACKQEVQPFTSGHRVALVYNHVPDGTEEGDNGGGEGERTSGAAPDQAPAIAALSALASRWSSLRAVAVAVGTADPLCSLQSEWHWRDSFPDDSYIDRLESGGTPRWERAENVELSRRLVVLNMLLCFLDHQYSADGLGWGAFQGRDAALLDALLHARVLARRGGGDGVGESPPPRDEAASGATVAAAAAPAFTLYAVPVRVKRLDLESEYQYQPYLDLHFADDRLPALRHPPAAVAAAAAADARPADRHFGWDQVAHDDDRLLEDRAADERDFEPHGNEGARMTR